MMKKPQRWNIKLVRNINGIESSMNIELPEDYSDMLTNLDKVDEAYHQSVFAGVFQHVNSNYGNAGWHGKELFIDAE
jgi:hypothetical protein